MHEGCNKVVAKVAAGLPHVGAETENIKWEAPAKYFSFRRHFTARGAARGASDWRRNRKYLAGNLPPDASCFGSLVGQGVRQGVDL